jgi:hypothetical protein
MAYGEEAGRLGAHIMMLNAEPGLVDNDNNSALKVRGKIDYLAFMYTFPPYMFPKPGRTFREDTGNIRGTLSKPSPPAPLLPPGDGGGPSLPLHLPRLRLPKAGGTFREHSRNIQ